MERGYAGMLRDPDSGLSMTLYRAYNPLTGRWLSRDPVGEGADPGGKLYAYVGGDAVNLTDPLGLCSRRGGGDPPPLRCRLANALFPGGKGTNQLGYAGTAQPGPVAVTGGGGVAIDKYGNVGLYSFIGGGAGLGAYIGGGPSIQVSNADGIANLNGLFVNASGSGGIGPGATADVFVGSSNKGPVSGGGITFGPGAGIGTFGGATFTFVNPLFNIKSILGCK